MSPITCVSSPTGRRSTWLPVLFVVLVTLLAETSGSPIVKNHPVETKWGDKARLGCKFDPKEQQFMRWETSDGLPIDTRRQTNYKITDDYQLHIRNTTLNEVGQYHCVVRQQKPPHAEERIAADRLRLRVDGLENVGDGDDPMLKHGKDAASVLRKSQTALALTIFCFFAMTVYRT